MKLLAVRRLLRIQRVVIRYRLDDLLFDLPLPWFLLALRYVLPWRWFPRKPLDLSRGARLRLALQDLGPIFIKFGQILSTRRDLLPEDIADELMRLQDRVPPFDSQLSVKLIEEQLGKKISEVFSRFDVEPLASASVAQVHAAQLKTGEEVVVKVIRPGLKPIIAQDLAWLFILARAAEKVSADARLLHPVDVVSDYEKTIYDELDLLREAANASQLKRNFEGSPLLYVPQVYWDWCRPKVLVMERIYGIQVTDLATLADQRTDMKMLAERGVEIFFTQVFRDSFFHADMHPGNIFVSTVNPWSPQYIAIDCGIVGSLTPEDQDYLARNLFAFFKRDYRRVAQLHIDSGWVPGNQAQRIRSGDPYRVRADLRKTVKRYFLRSGADAPVPDRSALQHGGSAAVGSAAKNLVEHRRPGPSAVPGPRPVEHRAAVPRALDARTGQPQSPARQRAEPVRTDPAPGQHGPRPARTHVPAPRLRPAASVASTPGRLVPAPARYGPSGRWRHPCRWRAIESVGLLASWHHDGGRFVSGRAPIASCAAHWHTVSTPELDY